MDSESDCTQPLQFETAIPRDAPPDPQVASQGVTCAACSRSLTDQYYDVNGQSVCESCRDQIAQHGVTPQGMGLFVRAGLFGLGAALAGASLYYAVIAITNFEIGLVAIAIGFMVGYAVRRGAGGRGGRRFQVLALVLTYWAVGLAYVPFAFGRAPQESQETSAATLGAPAAPADSAPSADSSSDMGFGFAVVIMVALSLALPVLSAVNSMPGGLISAAIIGFGMHQAWRMTGALQMQITGPYQIKAEPAALA